jgi:type I restriction enzyme S subunit
MEGEPMKYPAYQKYKESGVVWLGEVPKHWELKAIKWESLVQRGASPRPIDDPIYFDDEGEYAWVRISDVTAAGMYLENTEQQLSELGSALSVRMQPGSLFLSIAGTVGKPCITKIKCCIHDGFVYFPRWKGDSRFLFYIFASGEPYKGLGKMGTQLNLNTDTVGGINIGLPDHDGQTAIADFLDRETGRIDTLVAKKKALIALLKEKRTALISRTVTRGLPVEVANEFGFEPHTRFKDSGIEWLGEVPEGWEVKRLSYLALLKSGESITSEQIAEGGEYPVYGGNGLRGHFSAYTHDGAFVLIGRQGALCGNINYATGKFWASEHAVVVNPLTTFAERWLGELLFAMNLNQYSVSAAQPGLSVSQICSLKIPVPPIPEQIAIAAYLDRETARIDRLEEKVMSAIERLREYRTALITAAVTGKIDVREGGS